METQQDMDSVIARLRVKKSETFATMLGVWNHLITN
jgi:hypothetical protein